MKELVVISGKGGTGKTSLTAAFAALAGTSVVADCDVDAADLHLLLRPSVRKREPFRAGHEALIRAERCIGCGACLARCRFDAVIRVPANDAAVRAARDECEDGSRRSCPVKHTGEMEALRELLADKPDSLFRVDPLRCEGCGACVDACPVGAIDFPEREAGEWFVSDTSFGPLVHARLEPGGENSGKLVTRVREAARSEAVAAGLDRILVDGPPGIGCAVIASMTGATAALGVTEPTPSGAHDLKRVLELARHFDLPILVCVNKWDLHPGEADAIEAAARASDAQPVGRIRYDAHVWTALSAGRNIVDCEGPAADDVRAVWNNIQTAMEKLPG